MKRRLFTALCVVGLMVGWAVAPAHAQTFTAQIQQFWDQLRTGRIAFTTLRITGTGSSPFSLTGSVNGQFRLIVQNTNTGTGAWADLLVQSGTTNAYMGASNQNYSFAGPAGAANRSWLDTSTSAGSGWDIIASAAAGNVKVYAGGYAATNLRVAFDANASSATVFSVSGTVALAINNSGVVLANGFPLLFSGGAVGSQDTSLVRTAAGQLTFTTAAKGVEVNAGVASLGTCTAGSIVAGSRNASGSYTGNTSSSCVINFGTPNWTNAPDCGAWSQASTTHPRISARSASSITITGGVSGEAITYICNGQIGT